MMKGKSRSGAARLAIGGRGTMTVTLVLISLFFILLLNSGDSRAEEDSDDRFLRAEEIRKGKHTGVLWGDNTDCYRVSVPADYKITVKLSETDSVRLSTYVYQGSEEGEAEWKLLEDRGNRVSYVSSGDKNFYILLSLTSMSEGSGEYEIMVSLERSLSQRTIGSVGIASLIIIAGLLGLAIRKTIDRYDLEPDVEDKGLRYSSVLFMIGGGVNLITSGAYITALFDPGNYLPPASVLSLGFLHFLCIFSLLASILVLYRAKPFYKLTFVLIPVYIFGVLTASYFSVLIFTSDAAYVGFLDNYLLLALTVPLISLPLTVGGLITMKWFKSNFEALHEAEYDSYGEFDQFESVGPENNGISRGRERYDNNQYEDRGLVE